jgi:hypothetical protein
MIMKIRTGSILAATAALALGCYIQGAGAQDLNGPTQKGDICMQKIFGSPVTNSNKLNCTANDIRISEATEVFPKKCTAGTSFTLKGTFRTVVTANARYDAGYFFRTDGGPNARGDDPNATGQCSLSALTPGVKDGLNLDNDTAGDLNAGTYLVTFEIPNVMCVDTNNNGMLNLPNCTSWHSNAGTVATISNPFGLNDAATFDPDTKSKCVCNDLFEVPVEVENASITVKKAASTASVKENGAVVTFTATVTNDSQVVALKITSIKDQITNGSLHDLSGIQGCAAGQPTVGSPGPCSTPGMVSCPSLIGTTLPAGGSASCYYDLFIDGNKGDTHEDTVTICGTSDKNAPCGSDKATVAVTDFVGLAPTLTKTAVSAGCDVKVNYQVSVTNNSAVDTQIVNKLTDDFFGDITQVQGDIVSTTCATPKTIAKSGNYSCSFVAKIADQSCSINHTNKVTGTVVDDDGVPSSPSDTATVKVQATFP